MEKLLIPLPSNRSFGFLFSIFFAMLSAYASYIDINVLFVYFMIIASATLLLITITVPNALTPLNKVWIKIGDVMGKLISPLVIGIIFFCLITPVAITTKLFGRDELRLKKKNFSSSYWISRIPPGPAGETFKNQF